MTVLVTGATGLVGARLLPRLVQAGIDCRALVRPGRRAPAGVPAVPGDLADASTLVQAVAGVTDVVHLAAVFRTPDTDLVWRSNLDGTRHLLAALQGHAPDARVVLASTSNVYPVDSARPGREDDPVDPAHAYPASKVAAERALRDSGLTWAVLRFPFVYGDSDGHLDDLPGHAVAGGWHPAKRMSTIHHRDIATAVRMALDGTFDGRVVNVADEAPTSLYELAALVGKELAPSSAPLEHPWHLHVDVSLARSLGFRPTVRTVHQAAQEGLI